MATTRLSYALAGLLLAFPLAGQDQGRVLTLEQCVQTALANGLENGILRDTLQVAREQHLQVVASGSFSMSGSVGYSQASNVDAALLSSKAVSAALPAAGAQASVELGGPLTSLSLTSFPYLPPADSPSSAVEASIKQILWNGYPGGPLRAAVRKSLLSLRGKELGDTSGRLALIQRLEQAYYLMLSAQRVIGVREQNLQKQNSFLQQMQAIYDLKQASLADLQTAQLNVRSAEIDLRSAQHDLRLARLRLAGLMGASPDEVFSVAEAEDPKPPSFSLEQAIQDGLAQRVELQQLDLNRKSNAIDLALARWQATPSVSVSAGAAWIQPWGETGAVAGEAGVSIGLPVVDSGLAARRREEKQRQDELYGLQEAALRRDITADITDAYGTVGLQLERLELARLSANNLDLLLEVAQTENRFGTMTNQDLLTAALNAVNGHNALAKARIDAQLAALALRNAMGQ